MPEVDIITRKDGFYVIFGHRYKDGFFQVARFKPGRLYKTQKGALRAANTWVNYER